ncbi:MAG: DUF1588 domain-containing protein [Myxococcales bacterium]|nr:DUF1588 domain-containing protein [Myxococcales bacterium]
MDLGIARGAVRPRDDLHDAWDVRARGRWPARGDAPPSARVRGAIVWRHQHPSGEQRGGVLSQASVLTVTSYPTRTSPVIRGKWVLSNLLGTPPPPPLPNVPSLENTVGEGLSVRERLAQHRAQHLGGGSGRHDG